METLPELFSAFTFFTILFVYSVVNSKTKHEKHYKKH